MNQNIKQLQVIFIIKIIVTMKMQFVQEFCFASYFHPIVKILLTPDHYNIHS